MADPEAAATTAATTKADQAVAIEKYLVGLRIDEAIRQLQAIGGSVAVMPAIAEEVEDHDLLTPDQQEVLDNLVRVLEDEDSLVPTPAKAHDFVSEFRF